MLRYRVNEEYKEDTWESLVDEITQTTSDTVYRLETQDIYVNKNIGTITSLVTLDFGNCDVHLSPSDSFVDKNEGIIINGKFIIEEGNVDMDSLNFGIICNTNSNSIENCEVLVKQIELKGVDNKDLNVGILSSVNNGTIGNCSVELGNFSLSHGRNVNCGIVTAVNNNSVQNCVLRNVQNCGLSAFTLLNFGLVSGINKEGNITNVTIDSVGTISVDSSVNSNVGMFSGACVNGFIRHSSVGIIENISALSIDHLYLGSMVGYMDDRSELSGCFTKDIRNILTDSCHKCYTGGAIGYVGSGCRVMNCTLENVSSMTSVDNKYSSTGGLVSVNNGSISDSSVLNVTKIETTDDEIIGTVGGVVGKNFGTLQTVNVNTVGSLSVRNSDTCNIGSVCGYNESSVSKVTIKSVENLCSSGKTNVVGGVCGVNNGIVDSCQISKLDTVESLGGSENCTGGLCGHNISQMTNNTVITPIISSVQSFGKLSSISTVENNIFTTIDMSRIERYTYDESESEAFGRSNFFLDKNVSSLEKCFPENFNEDVNHLNTSCIKSLKETFKNTKTFNQPLDDWDTINVSDMTYTFKDSFNFNKDISKWNFSRVVGEKNDKMLGIIENTSMSSRNVGRFITILYNFILTNRSKGVPLDIGSLPQLPEVNTFERYVLFLLQKNHNLFFTEEGNKKDITLAEIKLEPKELVIFPLKDNNRVTSRYDRIIFIKIDTAYDYRFVIKNGDGETGDDVYFSHDSVKKIYKFRKQNGDTFTKDVYSDNLLSNVVENIIPPFFYIPVSLNTFNNFSLRLASWDMDNTNVILIPKVGIHSKDSEIVNTLHVHSWGGVPFFSMAHMFNEESSTNTITNVILEDTPELTYCVSTEAMFKGVENFMSDTSHFQMNRVENMREMFKGCRYFNSDISKWDVLKARDMTDILDSCMSFNQDLSHWSIPTITKSMKEKYKNAHVTKESLSQIETHDVEDFESAFENATFSADAYEILREWNVGSAVTMRNMFKGSDFKGDISNWDVSKVRDMTGMFENVRDLSGDFSSWNTKNLMILDSTFKNTTHSGNFGNWNTRHLISANETFASAGSVSGLEKWDITNVRNMNAMFEKTLVENMDDVFLSWAKQRIIYTPNLSIGDSEYSSSARPAKISLMSMGWDITGTFTEPLKANMIGDPYITPIYGDVYKIPDVECCYRLYQSKKVSINGKIEKFNDIQALNTVVKKLNETKFDGKLDTENLRFDDMYFITKLVIKIGDDACEYDLEKEDWTTCVPNSITGDYHLQFVDNLNEFYQREKIRTRQISIGDLKLKLYKCDNPQIHTGIEILSAEKNATGILVYETVSPTAMLKNIYDFDSVNMKRATDKDGVWIKEQFFTSNGKNLVKKIRVL